MILLLSRHPVRYNNAGLSSAPSPGNWRPIILEVSSSSENVSQKGAKFEEDPRTYSSKASRIVLPTFGVLDDHDGDLVSSSVGSLERCLHTINTSLCSWLPEYCNFLSGLQKKHQRTGCHLLGSGTVPKP
jgi:hypothetical protein